MIQNRLKAWRQKLGFTQQELVEKAKVSIATIVLIERYGYVPGADVRAKIAKTLGISEAAIWPTLEVSDDKA